MALGAINSVSSRIAKSDAGIRVPVFGCAKTGITMLLILLLTLTACGVQRPLVRPNEIPQNTQEEAEQN